METEAANGLPPQQQHYTQKKNAFTLKAARNLNAAALAGLDAGKVKYFLASLAGCFVYQTHATSCNCYLYFLYQLRLLSKGTAFWRKFHGVERAVKQCGAKAESSTRQVPPPSQLCG